MSFGKTVGNVRYTRSYTGESSAGLAGELNKAVDSLPVSVKAEALLATDGTYALTIEADGQTATVTGVEPDDLAQRIARLIHKVSKAVVSGELSKNRQTDSCPLGMNAPRGSKQNLRFG